MAFKLPKIDKTNSTEVTKTLDHKSGISITLAFNRKRSESYIKSVSFIAEQEQKTTLTMDALKNINNRLSSFDSQLFAVGEYLIKDWDVTDSDGNDIEPSGEVFLQVCNSIEDNEELLDFINSVFELIPEMAKEYAEKVGNIKKKPSKSGNTAQK